VDLLTTRLGRALASPAIVVLLRLAGLVVFAVTVLAGFIGDQNPYRNIAPTLVWIVWWVGFAYVSAFVGNLWDVINPWRTIFDAAAWLWHRCGGGALSLGLRYPHALGAWPACILLLAFSWIELVSEVAAVPAQLSCLAVAYAILTFVGMILFGRDAWLANGEVFSVAFGLFARLAPMHVRRSPEPPHERQWLLRPFGAGLLDGKPVSTSMTAFVLLMLSTVLYDGFLATPAWTAFDGAMRGALSGLEFDAGIAVKTAALLAFWLVFVAAYGAICTVMSMAIGGAPTPLVIARTFVLTLVPIAVGYHVAHYLVFLLVQGQYIVPLASDPFGYGWNLFGTAGYRVDIGLVGARFAWYVAAATIVAGHVTAVYLAHVKAMRVLGDRSLALRSQVPLTALMVVYTFTGLSIIAEPIVEQRAPAAPTAVADTVEIPAEALAVEPDSGGLQPVGPDKSARLKLAYSVLGSAFHDGTRTSAADLVYSYAFAYRWGVRRDGEDAHYDPVVDAATASLRRHLVAFQVRSSDTTSRSFRVGDVNFVRELLVVDVYLALAPGDNEQDAVIAPPWSTLPWHLVVLMEEAVGRGWAAFSKAAAANRGVPWLDLVRSEELKQKLAMLVDTFARDGHRPDALQALVSRDEARRRWAALAAFHKANGHYIVTNGPYRLKSWSADGVTLEAFRDLTYPLGVGSYDAYAIPRRGYVTRAEQTGDRVTISGEIEVIEKFQRSYRLVRTPLSSVRADVLKRAAPECRYSITDDNGRVVLASVLPLGEATACAIELSGRLVSGRYTMFALIAVNGNVMNADVRRIPILIEAKP
jgi:hypothetical protein